MVSLRTEYLRAQNQVDREKESLRGYQERELQMKARNEALQDAQQRLKLELEQALLAKPGAAIAQANLPTGDGMHNRITAFEMSMNKLTSEAGTVQSQILGLPGQQQNQERSSSAATDAALRLQDKLNSERAAFEAERYECDEIVSQMTRELELLLEENKRLKNQPGQPVPMESASSAPYHASSQRSYG